MKNLFKMASAAQVKFIYEVGDQGKDEEALINSIEDKTTDVPAGILRDKIENDLSLIEPQERMTILKQMFEVAQKEARETNEGALSEILPILEKIKHLYLDPESYGGENRMWYEKEKFEKMETKLTEYSGDMSGFIETIAEEWKNFDPFANNGNNDVFTEKVTGEPLIKAFKEYIEKHVKDFDTARTASYVFDHAMEKLEQETTLE